MVKRNPTHNKNTKPSQSSNLLENYHLLSYDVLDSTNEEARRLAERGESHGAVIWARKQTAGKGRLQRSWVSEEGNLYVSILLAPECDLKTASQLSFVAAVAALEAIAPVLPHGGALHCKWPNDILMNGKKLGGILLESFMTPKSNQQWVVVGVGINIDSCPKKVNFPATYLKESGVEIVSAKIILSRFIHEFIRCYDNWKKKGFGPVRRQWLKNAYRLGDPITVKLIDDKLLGIFKGIDDDGALIIGLPGRKKALLHSGDVSFS